MARFCLLLAWKLKHQDDQMFVNSLLKLKGPDDQVFVASLLKLKGKNGQVFVTSFLSKGSNSTNLSRRLPILQPLSWPLNFTTILPLMRLSPIFSQKEYQKFLGT